MCACARSPVGDSPQTRAAPRPSQVPRHPRPLCPARPPSGAALRKARCSQRPGDARLPVAPHAAAAAHVRAGHPAAPRLHLRTTPRSEQDLPTRSLPRLLLSTSPPRVPGGRGSQGLFLPQAPMRLALPRGHPVSTQRSLPGDHVPDSHPRPCPLRSRPVSVLTSCSS